jgi:hypothetical protein
VKDNGMGIPNKYEKYNPTSRNEYARLESEVYNID